MFFCVLCARALVSIHCCLVVTCLEWADLLALVGVVYCVFVTFPCGILGQLLIVLFPDLCRLSYFIDKGVFLSKIIYLFYFGLSQKTLQHKTSLSQKYLVNIYM